MPEDVLVEQVENELDRLQDQLKDRLKQANDLSDLNKHVMTSSLTIEKHTEKLEKTSTKVKWKWLLQYMKWTIILVLIIFLLLFILYKAFIK